MVEMFLDVSLLLEGNMTRAIELSQSYCGKNFEPSDPSLTGGVAANLKRMALFQAPSKLAA